MISHETDITRTEENDPEILYIQRKFLPSRHFYSLKQPSKILQTISFLSGYIFELAVIFCQIVPSKICHEYGEQLSSSAFLLGCYGIRSDVIMTYFVWNRNVLDLCAKRIVEACEKSSRVSYSILLDCQEKITDNDRNIMSYREGSRLWWLADRKKGSKAN